MSKQPKILEVKNLSKSYNGKIILNKVSLAADLHEVISIIGPSGTGKSTFLRCINFLTSPEKIEIFLQGKKIPLVKHKGELKVKYPKDLLHLRQRVGFVFQNFNLWQHKNVLENIIEAPIQVLRQKRATSIMEAEQLLEKVGMLAKKDSYPHELSGGEQQRVAIARTLAMKPSVILLDEPTSALDPEKTKEVTDVLTKIAKEGITMIIVSHEMTFCKNISNKIIFLNEGKIEEEGSPEEIFENPKSSRLQQFLESV